MNTLKDLKNQYPSPKYPKGNKIFAVCFVISLLWIDLAQSKWNRSIWSLSYFKAIQFVTGNWVNWQSTQTQSQFVTDNWVNWQSTQMQSAVSLSSTQGLKS